MLIFSMPQFFCATWIMVMIISLEIHGYRSCIKAERKGLLEFNAYVNPPYDWPNDMDSDCCGWERVQCDQTSGRVIGLFFNDTIYNDYIQLNLSLLHPFEELQTLNLSKFRWEGWYDDIYGYKSFEILKNLEILDLSNNGVNSSVLPFLNAASSLKALILRKNYMGGTFPGKEMKNLGNLELLDLSTNNFTGPVQGLEDFHNLQGLDLSNNVFTGSLEITGLCQLKKLVELDLSENRFFGEIPKELGDLQRIRALNLSHNSLSGLIPGSFSNLTVIESLDISFNMLHGPIPENLTKLYYLVIFNVSYNSLSGSIPSQGKFSTLDETNYIANPLLCGSPVDKTCDNDTPEHGETTIDMEVFYWCLAVTYSITLMEFIWFLCFDSPWRRAWFRLVDAFIKLFTCV